MQLISANCGRYVFQLINRMLPCKKLKERKKKLKREEKRNNEKKDKQGKNEEGGNSSVTTLEGRFTYITTFHHYESIS